MKQLTFTFLIVAIPLSLLSGCVSTRESAEQATDVPTTTSALEAQSELKVGVVDLMEVMKRSKVGQPALAAWRLEEEKLAEEASADNLLLEELGKRGVVNGGIEWHKYRQEVMEHQKRSFQRLAESNNVFTNSYARAVASVLPKVSMATRIIAEAGGFTAVLNKGSTQTIVVTFYAGKVFDLTDQVVEELDRQFP